MTPCTTGVVRRALTIIVGDKLSQIVARACTLIAMVTGTVLEKHSRHPERIGCEQGGIRTVRAVRIRS